MFSKIRVLAWEYVYDLVGFEKGFVSSLVFEGFPLLCLALFVLK